MMQRRLSSFPLSVSQQSKLALAGFETAGDLKGMRIADISSELSITPSEALEIVRVVTGGQGEGSDSVTFSTAPLRAGQSVLTLLQEEESRGSIVTFCAKLDETLGGGVPLGKITEVCGAPGLGKTQLSFQVCVDVRIPEAFGGVSGEAVYIDTEGSFVVQRLVEIAQAAKQHIDSIAEARDDPEMQKVANGFTLEHILSGIHCYRSHSYLDLVAIMNVLPEFIEAHPQVKLVVIDSIAAHFRHGFECMTLRNRILGGLSQSLIMIATRYKLAVVLTNQMTTRVSHKPGKPAQLVPALGDSWGHACTLRVVLHWNNNSRFASLVKSPSLKEATVPYQITGSGVRDVDHSLESNKSPSLVDSGASHLEGLDHNDVTQLDEPWEEEGKEEEEEMLDFVSALEVHSGHQSDDFCGTKRPCVRPSSEL